MMMAGAALVAVPAAGQKADDTNRLIDQGMNHSQVMTIAQEMTDGLGPRLTNSPGMRRAEQWAIDKFNGWGLANVHRDGFEFGRGWERSEEHTSELQSIMRISYAVFCLKKKNKYKDNILQCEKLEETK